MDVWQKQSRFRNDGCSRFEPGMVMQWILKKCQVFSDFFFFCNKITVFYDPITEFWFSTTLIFTPLFKFNFILALAIILR